MRVVNRFIEFAIGAKHSKAFLFAGAARVWQLIVGFAILYAISSSFSKEIQGYYYVVLSLLAMQAFFELGMSVVIMTFSAHQWAFLKFDNKQIQGDECHISKLSDIFKKSVRWYGVAAILYILIITPVGYFILSEQGSAISWESPWIISIILSAILVFLQPLYSILEGCGMIEQVTKFRFYEASLSSVVLLISIYSGMGLWAISAQYTIRLFIQLFFIFRDKWPFFRYLLRTVITEKVEWKREIFPMQYKLAAHAIMAYLTFSAITLLIFKYIGPVEAGKIGMSFQIIGVVGSIGVIWVQIMGPRFAILAAAKRFEELDNSYKQIMKSSVSLLFVLCCAAVMLLQLAEFIHLAFSERLLGMHDFSILFLSIVAGQIIQVQAAYIRAHKKDEMLHIHIILGILCTVLIAYFSFIKSISFVVIVYSFTRVVMVIWHFILIERRKGVWRRDVSLQQVYAYAGTTLEKKAGWVNKT